MLKSYTYAFLTSLMFFYFNYQALAQCGETDGVIIENAYCDGYLIEVFPTGETYQIGTMVGGFQPIGTVISCDYTLGSSGCSGWPIVNISCYSVVEEVVGDCSLDIGLSLDMDGYIAFPIIANNWLVSTISWSLNNEVAQSDEIFQLSVTDTGSLCLTVEMVTEFGDTCVRTDCMELNFSNDPLCADESLIDTSIVCDDVYAPVCGCDGITYNNICEAMSHSGVVDFTPGPCGTDTLGCSVSFDFSINLENLNEYTFTNTTPNSVFTIWMVDDSVFEESTESLEIELSDGSHFIGMMAGTMECLNATFQIINIGEDGSLWGDDASDFGSFVQYVYPGDADQNGVANLYDVLTVGIQNSINGFPRPSATDSWYGQLGFTWQEAIAGVNLMHVDCNGDGIIDAADLNVIQTNITPIETADLEAIPNVPTISLELASDTVYINNINNQTINLEASLKLASGDMPIYDIAGLAVSFEMPADLTKDIQVDYNDNSIFGSSNEIFWESKYFKSEGQVDLVFVRNNQTSVSGYGSLADVDILIDDAFILRTGTVIPFEITLKALKVIDSDGNIRDVSIDGDGVSTLIIVDKTVLSQMDPESQAKVRVFPSLIKDELTVSLDDLAVDYIAVYDVLSQKIIEMDQVDAITKMNTSDWAPGQYLVKIYTKKGFVIKKVVKY